MLEDQTLSERIIGAALEVHRTLGPGFLESVYEAALVIELRRCELELDRQVRVPIHYRGVEVGEHRLDLLVEGRFVVEIKAMRAVKDIHFAVVKSYLKASRNRSALLLNFGAHPLEIKRVFPYETAA